MNKILNKILLPLTENREHSDMRTEQPVTRTDRLAQRTKCPVEQAVDRVHRRLSRD